MEKEPGEQPSPGFWPGSTGPRTQETAPACGKSPGSGAGFDHVIGVVRLRGLSEWVTFSLAGLRRHLDLPILAQISEQNPWAHKDLSLSTSTVSLQTEPM